MDLTDKTGEMMLDGGRSGTAKFTGLAFRLLSNGSKKVLLKLFENVQDTTLAKRIGNLLNGNAELSCVSIPNKDLSSFHKNLISMNVASEVIENKASGINTIIFSDKDLTKVNKALENLIKDKLIGDKTTMSRESLKQKLEDLSKGRKTKLVQSKKVKAPDFNISK